MRFWAPSWMVLLLVAAGCSSTPSHLPDGAWPELVVESVEPGIILPGTWVQVTGRGFVDANTGSLVVELERGGSNPWILSPQRIDDEHLRVRIDAALFGTLGGPGSFQGLLRVRADYPGGGRQTDEFPVQWSLESNLVPNLGSLSAATEGIVYLGSQLLGDGSGFVLEGEGRTELRWTGTFVRGDNGQSTPLTAKPLAMPAESRLRLDGPFAADIFGIHPGTFQGEVSVVNVLCDDDECHTIRAEVPGNTLGGLTVELGPTVLTRVEPLSAGRGQPVDIAGRGFVADTAVTLVRIDGTFTTRGGEVRELHGADALQIAPEVLAGDHMRYVLRVVSDGQGGVTGLGSEPGVLRGVATPVIHQGADSVEGIAYPGELAFSVLPQKQVVYISYLPGFTDALRGFGLRNVEAQIRTRIDEVVARDYQGISVEFRTIRPTDFVEYAVIEVSGSDPNGAGLLGLDSTPGKDTGNLYFDDLLGGLNADSRESGHYGFGGVFVESFLGFSPHHPEPIPIASPVFDEVFGPFMSSQGGRQVEAGEYPGGERTAAIELAIHALGSMLGNTISHEIGHTLGLAAGPPDLFHNLDPQPDQIMDAGGERPFEERAEVNGSGPAHWTAENRAYLEKYLPL